jgi:hypothetical protein
MRMFDHIGYPRKYPKDDTTPPPMGDRTTMIPNQRGSLAHVALTCHGPDE